MKSILSAAALMIASAALVSCGSKDGDTASVKTHAEVGEGMAAAMSEMMTSMSGITDVASAEAFAAKMPEIKSQMKSLLAAAKELPAPTDEDKAAVTAMMDKAEEELGPKMMAMMMGLAQNPQADAIGKVLESVMEDEEMEAVVGELEDMYETEGEEGGAPEVGE